MPSRSCPRCGGPRPRSQRIPCPHCGQTPPPRQQRAYRGLAAYRAIRAAVFARDSETCVICGTVADCLGHVVPYSQQDPGTRDDPSTWTVDDFRATCADCERRNGTRPLEPPLGA